MLGGLIDKLANIDHAMWENQEVLYEIRRMTFEQFHERFLSSDQKMRELHQVLTKCCDLNVHRNQLIDEIDHSLVEMIDNEP